MATTAVIAAVALLRRPDSEFAPSCPQCQIHIEPHLQLDGGLRGVLATPTAFARDSRGRYYIAPTIERGRIAVYDANGALRTTIGRYGSGPGELDEVQTLAIGAGDSLWVTDDRQRISVFTRDGTFSRSFQHARPGSLTSLCFPRQGRLSRALGPVPDPLPRSSSPSGTKPYGLTKAPRGQELGRTRLAASDDSTVVVVSESYAVTIFDNQSKKTSFAPAPDWFDEPLPESNSPRGQVLDIEVQDSLLWVLYREQHPQSVATRQLNESFTRIGPQEILARNTFFLDVLDLRKHQLIARTQVHDWVIGGLLGEDVIARREVDAGVEEVWVLRVKLVKP